MRKCAFDDRGGALFLAPRLLVAIDSDQDVAAFEQTLLQVSAGRIAERDWAGTSGQYLVRSGFRDGFDVLASANRLAGLPGVIYAEPDFAFRKAPCATCTFSLCSCTCFS